MPGFILVNVVAAGAHVACKWTAELGGHTVVLGQIAVASF